MRKEVQLYRKNNGEKLEGILIKEFDNHFLIVDFITCVQAVELSVYDFNEKFDETYIEFLNRV